MDIFPFIVFLGIGWIIYSNLKAAGKGLDKAGKAPARNHEQEVNEDWAYETQNYRQQRQNTSFGQRSGGQSSGPTQRGRERLKQRGSQETLQQRLKATSSRQALSRQPRPKERGRGEDYGLSRRHSPQKDQNRHRRHDWGQRGSDIITTKRLLVLLALGFIVLYILSQISP